MARRLLVLILLALPTAVSAINLELRQAGSSSSDILAVVGEEIDVEIWLDSGGQNVSGAAIFLSFDETVFELVDEDRDISPGFQPFQQGNFLSNGEVFRNDLLNPDDPAASFAGSQMDYSVVRAADNGTGSVARFRLRALVPSQSSTVHIDETGIRETRVFLPDGSHQSFRFIKPLTVRVQGISLVGIPDQLVLARGEIDSTSFKLDELIFDPLYGADQIDWIILPLGSIGLQHLSQPNSLVLTAPSEASTWERLVIVAENPDGQVATDTVDIFVNARPILTAPNLPLTFDEDDTIELELDPLVEDPDSANDKLVWHSSGALHVLATISSNPSRIRFEPVTNWSGEERFVITVSDEYGFTDSMHVEVVVNAVNDPPEFVIAPNFRLTVGRRDDSVLISELIADLEDPTETLELEWTQAVNFGLEIHDGRLVVDAGLEWTGTEEIELLVRDSGGLSATIPLTVTVVRSLPPTLINPPRRLGMAAGSEHIMNLDDFVTDPDNNGTELLWEVRGHQELEVQLSQSRAVRIEAPVSFTGIEVLTFSVADPSGERASFELIVFSALADGVPLLSPIPDVSVPLDGVDATLDLDDFVFDLDHEPSQIDWFLPARDDITLRIDPVTHVLTVAPTSNAIAGIAELLVTAIDPDGHKASQTIRIHLVGTGPASSFAVAPIPDISITHEESFRLELDSFVSGDADPRQIQWTVEGQKNLLVEVDPVSHAVVIRGSSSWTGTEEIVFVAAGAASVKRRTVRVTIRSTAGITSPSLASLPRLTLRAGTFDQSLDLDDFVSGIDPATLSWTAITTSENLQVLIDPQSHAVVILPSADWRGEEQLVLEARDASGTLLTGILVVEVVAEQLGLELKEVRAPVFSGETEFRLRVADLVVGETKPAELAWTAIGTGSISVTYDSRFEELLLKTDEPWNTNEIITLIARDREQVETTGHVLLQVYPADGSVGSLSAEFQLVVVPNVLQPDFLDLFILSNINLKRSPLLGLQDGGSQLLDLNLLTNGIWHSTHVLEPGQEGNVTFVALGLDDDLNLLKADLAMTVGTVLAGSAKRITGDGVELDFDLDSFDADGVVAILPGRDKEISTELIPLAQPVFVHASEPFRHEGGQIYMDRVPNSRRPGIYRWAEKNRHWVFAGAAETEARIEAPLDGNGLYALMEDLTPPVLEEEELNGRQLRFRFSDGGSGVAPPVVTIDGHVVPDKGHTWDGRWLELDTRRAVMAGDLLGVNFEDRVGNRGALVERELRELAGSQPFRFSLGQNFPNPFNPSTTIPLEVNGPTAATVQLQVFNAGGQLTRVLLREQLAPGSYQVNWDARGRDGRDVAAGVYFYRLLIDDRIETRKMNLVR